MRKTVQVFRRVWTAWLIIAGITLILYSGTFSYGILYNYDDDAYLFDPRITHLNAGNTLEYFSDYYLGMYQPLPVLSFAFLDQLFPGSVMAQRVTNFLLHCLNALLVLILVRRLTRNFWIGALTSLFFAIHPVHVESVTWISARSNLMYSFFFLGGLIFYTRWQEDRKWRSWILVFLCFLVSLFCKVTAVTFPAVLVLLDLYHSRTIPRRTLLLYVPIVLLSCLFVWIGVNASGSFGHISDLGLEYTAIDRIFILLHALWLYISRFFVPENLSVIFLYPWKASGALPVHYLLTGILALAGISLLLVTGWMNRRKESGRAILFGLLFFLITISVVLPLKWSRTLLIAERYTYIPYIGLAAGVLMLVFYFAEKSGRWIRIPLLLVLVCYSVLFSYQCYQRNRVWKDPVTLFTDVIEKNRSRAEVSMGYYNRGNEYLRLKMPGKALADYSEAIRLYPEYRDAYYNRGIVLYQTGDYLSAVRDYSKAIGLKSDFYDAYLNRGTAYRAMGRYREALSDYDHVILHFPYGIAFYSRGVLYYFNLDNKRQGCEDWKEAIRLGFKPAEEMVKRFCSSR